MHLAFKCSNTDSVYIVIIGEKCNEYELDRWSLKRMFFAYVEYSERKHVNLAA